LINFTQGLLDPFPTRRGVVFLAGEARLVGVLLAGAFLPILAGEARLVGVLLAGTVLPILTGDVRRRVERRVGEATRTGDPFRTVLDKALVLILDLSGVGRRVGEATRTGDPFRTVLGKALVLILDLSGVNLRERTGDVKRKVLSLISYFIKIRKFS